MCRPGRLSMCKPMESICIIYEVRLYLNMYSVKIVRYMVTGEIFILVS